ncbi:Uncharacterized protein DAT39_004562 [Clarias magur]|uniref:Uncharacterized protein n=1 Tax=Clarias magur TaxID=1594786 RepID=A0A8J4U6E4_CLAMG|nr:Uncharacterized protein DAT39_004562 [Clarias magur]
MFEKSVCALLPSFTPTPCVYEWLSEIDATNPHSFAVDQCKSASVNEPPSPLSPWLLMYFSTINQL